MTALNQLIIGLLLVVVTANIGNVNCKCTPIKLNIKAEYLVSSLLADYKHTRDISSSSSFKRNYDSLDTSATVSGNYGGFSGSASASFSKVSEAETSNSQLTDRTRTTKVTYSKGQNHVIEKLTETVTINGRSKTIVSREIKYPVLVKDSPSHSQLRKMGEDYIQYNYGGIRGGKIRRNTYEATACIEEPPCEDDEDEYRQARWNGLKFAIDAFPRCYDYVSYADGLNKRSICNGFLKNICRKSCGQCYD